MIWESTGKELLNTISKGEKEVNQPAMIEELKGEVRGGEVGDPYMLAASSSCSYTIKQPKLTRVKFQRQILNTILSGHRS